MEGREIGRKLAKRLGLLGGILASLGIASEVAEGSTHYSEVPGRLADESVFSHSVTSSDTVKYRIDESVGKFKNRCTKT